MHVFIGSSNCYSKVHIHYTTTLKHILSPLFSLVFFLFQTKSIFTWFLGSFNRGSVPCLYIIQLVYRGTDKQTYVAMYSIYMVCAILEKEEGEVLLLKNKDAFFGPHYREYCGRAKTRGKGAEISVSTR